MNTLKYIPRKHILSMEVLIPFISIKYVFDLLFAALLDSDYDNNLAYVLEVIERKEKPNPK